MVHIKVHTLAKEYTLLFIISWLVFFRHISKKYVAPKQSHTQNLFETLQHVSESLPLLVEVRSVYDSILV